MISFRMGFNILLLYLLKRSKVIINMSKKEGATIMATLDPNPGNKRRCNYVGPLVLYKLSYN